MMSSEEIYQCAEQNITRLVYFISKNSWQFIKIHEVETLNLFIPSFVILWRVFIANATFALFVTNKHKSMPRHALQNYPFQNNTAWN